MKSLIIVFFVIGLVTAVLALYRKLLSLQEEDIVHLAPGEERFIPQQLAMAHKMDVIDTWGKGLTIVTVVLGLALGAVYLYNLWLVNQQPFQ